MEKIGESPWNELTDIEEYHHTVLLSNKIWLFSRKCKLNWSPSAKVFLTYSNKLLHLIN